MSAAGHCAATRLLVRPDETARHPDLQCSPVHGTAVGTATPKRPKKFLFCQQRPRVTEARATVPTLLPTHKSKDEVTSNNDGPGGGGLCIKAPYVALWLRGVEVCNT